MWCFTSTNFFFFLILISNIQIKTPQMHFKKKNVCKKKKALIQDSRKSA